MYQGYCDGLDAFLSNNLYLNDLEIMLKRLLYELKFSRWFYFREFRESNPRENFHFNLCLFIVMTTSAKSRN